jgi:hypothetical protein
MSFIQRHHFGAVIAICRRGDSAGGPFSNMGLSVAGIHPELVTHIFSPAYRPDPQPHVPEKKPALLAAHGYH